MKIRFESKITEFSLFCVFILVTFSAVTPIAFSEIQNNQNTILQKDKNSPFSQTIDRYLNDGYNQMLSRSITLRTRPENVVDSYLATVLGNSVDDEELEIIIQFMSAVTDADMEKLDKFQLKIIHEFPTIFGVLAHGKPNAISRLADWKRVYWLEFNEPVEFHMEKSLTVINATKTWNTVVQDEYGNEQRSIDGTGVTVVVLDTGIDAGHPDLDYKEKTIQNLKSDFGLGPWVEMENSDTSYGHGTHCAGTVAGNGDASAGARRGVAPGANLIGLSIGDFGVNLANALGGYEWIYANTHPYTADSDDPNVRVVSNSWGPPAGKFDPTDAISQMILKCTVDKNVVSVFAAGNSGEDDHDGHTVETNPYGSVPMSIMVAATERDGSGMAVFSSRGQTELNETWPDVAAPGVRIWSAAARRTYISIMKNLQDWQDLDPYYFAISGTSMATPHVAGSVALLFQACPSLKLSAQHDDFSGQDEESYSELGGSWWESPITLVHEAELILEASTRYIEPSADNGVPTNNTIGWTGKRSDFAQGYGLINVEHAVAIALTLNELRNRDFNNDGRPDYPNASVYDAIEQYENIFANRNLISANNKLMAQWHGDWSWFHNQTTSPNLAFSTDQAHFVYIPETAEELVLTLSYEPIQTTEGKFSVAGIRLVIDYTDDGSPDWSGSMFPRDQPDTITLSTGEFSSYVGKLWNFNIEGVGFGLPNSPPGNFIGESYYEITVEFRVDLEIVFDSISDSVINGNLSSFDINNPKVENLRLSKRSQMPDSAGINLFTSIYDLGKVGPIQRRTPPEPEHRLEMPWLFWLLLLIAILILAVMFYRKYQKKKNT